MGLAQAESLTRGGETGRGLKTERAVRPAVIVVIFRGWQDRHGISEAVEDLLGQAFVAEPTMEVPGLAVSQGLP
jgi:hypothetical protein